jgi:hypothetical protein
MIVEIKVLLERRVFVETFCDEYRANRQLRYDSFVFRVLEVLASFALNALEPTILTSDCFNFCRSNL